LVIQEFKALYGDAKIEFRLATIDPFGNCTNGIDRVYTHLTNLASDISKVNQWQRSKYMNVWVTKTIGSSGTAGYAYYPTSTNNQGFWIDGIIILHQYIGSIGTGTPGNSRALTHEFGHTLALAHPWGNTNDPGVICGDDNIDDTPETEGWNFCPPNAAASMNCNPLVAENYQNFMDYSYCSYMFTKGQIAAMRTVLQGTDGQRNNLIKPENHIATGINLTTPPVCVPKADFSSNIKGACVGSTINFRDNSSNAPVTSWSWTFPGGTPSTSTVQNPSVVFNTPGSKDITLTVSNATGSNTVTFPNYVNISNTWADYMGPRAISLDGNGDQPEWFRTQNPQYNHASFQLTQNQGRGGSKGFKLNNYKNISQAELFTDDFFYYNRLEGAVDALITPSFDLRYTSGVTMSYDYSYASNANTVEAITEELKVFVSKDCGATWQSILSGNVIGAPLLSGGFASGLDYSPSNDNQWATKTFAVNNVHTTAGRAIFKFEFTASSLSSNLFLDNFNISGSGTAGLENDFGIANNLTIAPNPILSGSSLKIAYTANDEPVTFTLRSLQGEKILSIVRNETNQDVSFDLEIDASLAASYYFLEVRSASSTTVKKIAVVGK
jgi:PKD repeat protein